MTVATDNGNGLRPTALIESRHRPRLVINHPRDVQGAASLPGYEGVAQIFHKEWRGIRAAAGALPGQKIAISANRPMTGEEVTIVANFLVWKGVNRLCFHGFSKQAESLLTGLLERLPAKKLRVFVVTHVSPAQFEYDFEWNMYRALLEHAEDGAIERIGSVKPSLGVASPHVFPRTIINRPADGMRWLDFDRKANAAFLPLPFNWRKNLFTNILACSSHPLLEQVLFIQKPHFLEEEEPMIPNRHKLAYVGFQDYEGSLSCMRHVKLGMNVTLAECQPMSIIEGVAQGTPVLTQELAIPELAPHPVQRLLTVRSPENLECIQDKITDVLSFCSAHPHQWKEMAQDYLSLMCRLNAESYAEFLQL